MRPDSRAGRPFSRPKSAPGRSWSSREPSATATTTARIAPNSTGLGTWASTTNPTAVALTGSNASNTANRARPTLRSTTWSSTYGSTLLNTPTPAPIRPGHRPSVRRRPVPPRHQSALKQPSPGQSGSPGRRTRTGHRTRWQPPCPGAAERWPHPLASDRYRTCRIALTSQAPALCRCDD